MTQYRDAPHSKADEHDEQAADGEEHAFKLRVIAEHSAYRAEQRAHESVTHEPPSVIQQGAALREHYPAAHPDAVDAGQHAYNEERAEPGSALRRRDFHKPRNCGDHKVQADDRGEGYRIRPRAAAAPADGIARVREYARYLIGRYDIRIIDRGHLTSAIACLAADYAARVQEPVGYLVLALRADHPIDLGDKAFIYHSSLTSGR